MKKRVAASVFRTMTHDPARYVERTPWPHWAGAVFWGALVLGAWAVLTGADSDVRPEFRGPTALGILTFGVVIRVVVGGMAVRVDRSGIFLHLGLVPVLVRRIPFEEIERLEVVRYRPIREFGGWGIRGWGKKKAWTARGNQAVRLHLPGERLLYVGSDTPQRLAERIRTIGKLDLRVG